MVAPGTSMDIKVEGVVLINQSLGYMPPSTHGSMRDGERPSIIKR